MSAYSVTLKWYSDINWQLGCNRFKIILALASTLTIYAARVHKHIRCQILFNQAIVPQSYKLLGLLERDFVQVGSPSRCPTNSFKAL